MIEGPDTPAELTHQDRQHVRDVLVPMSPFYLPLCKYSRSVQCVSVSNKCHGNLGHFPLPLSPSPFLSPYFSFSLSLSLHLFSLLFHFHSVCRPPCSPCLSSALLPKHAGHWPGSVNSDLVWQGSYLGDCGNGWPLHFPIYSMGFQQERFHTHATFHQAPLFPNTMEASQFRHAQYWTGHTALCAETETHRNTHTHTHTHTVPQTGAGGCVLSSCPIINFNSLLLNKPVCTLIQSLWCMNRCRLFKHGDLAVDNPV